MNQMKDQYILLEIFASFFVTKMKMAPHGYESELGQH